jgi:hypothetical protein
MQRPPGIIHQDQVFFASEKLFSTESFQSRLTSVQAGSIGSDLLLDQSLFSDNFRRRLVYA